MCVWGEQVEVVQPTGVEWSAGIQRTERPAGRVGGRVPEAEETVRVVAGGGRACVADGDAGRSRVAKRRIWWSASVRRMERPIDHVGGWAPEAEQATGGGEDGRRAGGGWVCTRAVEICSGRAHG